MKNNQKQIRYFVQILLHLQKNKVTENQDGYAMLITSILAILMFSMLSVYLFSANLYKSVASSVVDGGTTFFAAETGMNQRADAVRERFEGFARPAGTEPSDVSSGLTSVAAQMQNCINDRSVSGSTMVGSGDFACSNRESDYRESRWKADGSNKFVETRDNNPNIKYRAYSFMRDLTAGNPITRRIPPGEFLAGLNMQEYRYRIYTTAIKESGGYLPISAQALLQMDFNSRVIPLFQFAAFYDGDLEILPGAAMTLSGPVHSNGDLYLGSGNLTIEGSVTALNGIYNKRKNDNSTSGGTASIRMPTATVTLLSANGGISTTAALPPAGLQTSFGDFVRAGVPRLAIPQPGFLGKTDTQQTSGIGQYYGKADLRIQYQPNQTNPIVVTAIKTGFAADPASPCTGLSIPTDRNGFSSLVCTTLSNEQLRSITQPVLVRARNVNEVAGLSPDPTGDATKITAAGTPTAVQLIQRQNAALALQQAIVNQTTPVPLAELRGTTTITALAATSGAVGVRWTAIITDPKFSSFATEFARTPQAIANRAGYFYRVAPIQTYDSFFNNRESGFRPAANANGGNMKMLQTDIKSLTIWNRDNVVTNSASTTILPTATILDTTGIGTDETLFRRAQNLTIGKYASVCNGAAADSRNRSLQCLGLSASDTSEGGLVLHTTVLETIADSVVTSTPSRSSAYGFAFTGASNLPGALTIASDQAVYLQGDYNYYDGSNTTIPTGVNNVVTHPYNMSNNIPAAAGLKEPAAVLSDSLNVLSNSCINTTTRRLNCGVQGTSPNSINTNINAAFLAGVNVTVTGNYNGGLENYPRFHENWGGDTLLYRGSFISLGNSLKVLGTWGSQVYGVPSRNWNYDLAFNDMNNLPPLTPRVVYLKQKVFKRDYNNDRS